MVFQGSFMVSLGFWLVSMVFQSSFMVFHGFWLVSMVFQGSFMVFPIFIFFMSFIVFTDFTVLWCFQVSVEWVLEMEWWFLPVSSVKITTVHIFQIRQGAFAGLHSLDRLELRHNSLERLGAEVFTGISKGGIWWSWRGWCLFFHLQYLGIRYYLEDEPRCN